MSPEIDSAARQVDANLLAIEADIDWLPALSPTGNADRWQAFCASGYRTAPPLTYPPPRHEPADLRRRLADLPLDEVAHPLVAELLREKARELDRQNDLVALRGRDGFVQASIALFGAPEPSLLDAAQQILAVVPETRAAEADATAKTLAAAAVEARTRYREADPAFDFAIRVEADINSSLMVNRGELWIDADARVPASRVGALIAHEVGTHVVTFHNGSAQPLRQLSLGLAHYDPLQEGLAALAEWLAGDLPPGRLRVLAARVVAADAAVAGATLEAVFALLHEEHGIGAEPAFDTAVRALRGGGLTKDACYLAGLSELIVWLRQGHDLAPLFIGKMALTHLPALQRLAEEGLLRPPALLPHHLTGHGCAERLAAARTTPLTRFHTGEAE